MDFNILGSLTGLSTGSVQKGTAATGGNFFDMVNKAIAGTVQDQKVAEQMTAAAAQGENVPMHSVIQSIGKAEMTLQTMVTVRDKAVEAYQEVLRMPI